LFFVFSFLTTEKIKSNKVLFMNPSTMILLAFIEDPHELAEALSDLQLSKRDLVFIPINNNSDVTQAGGSHWSLLIFERHHNTFYYLDSAHEMNRLPASHTAAKLVPLLHPELVNPKKNHSSKGLFHFGSPHVGDDKQTRFHIVNSPQQDNGYDCGVYTIASAELIASADHPFKVR
jgi:sentrin-specific protease 8